MRHLDVDLTHRPDIAKHFHVLQTPTTLVLDGTASSRPASAASPSRDVLELELNRLTGENANV